MAIGAKTTHNEDLLGFEQRHNDKHVDHENRIAKLEQALDQLATKEDLLKLQLILAETKVLSWRFYIQTTLVIISTFCGAIAAVVGILQLLGS